MNSIRSASSSRRFAAPLAASVLLSSLLLASDGLAAQGDCGQPNSTGSVSTASDALATLRAAVGVASCALEICDVDGSCSITAGDALRVLLVAVGDTNTILACTCGVTTTTSTSTTTTTSTTSTTTSTTTTSTSTTTTTTLPVPPFWPADPADYMTGPLSYVNSITIPPVVGGVPTCCRDFGEISKNDGIDNGLSRLAASLTPFGIDFGEILTLAIMDGSLVVVLDHQFLEFENLAPPGSRALPDDFGLVRLVASFAGGTTFTEADAGLGEFVISRDTFLPGTAEPASFDFPSFMDIDTMTAGPFILPLTLPFGVLNLDLIAADAIVTADHGTITAAGVPYSGGEISGYVILDDTFNGFNEILNSPDCDCLGNTEDIFTQLPDGTWTGACIADATSLCPAPEQTVCAALAGRTFIPGDPPDGQAEICPALVSLLPANADINLDADPDTYEALSLGLEITGVPAASAGVEP